MAKAATKRKKKSVVKKQAKRDTAKRKRKINRSEEIRKLLHVGMVQPAEIIARIKADHGIDVSPSLISAIKSGGKKKGKKRGRRPNRNDRPADRANHSSPLANSVAQLIEAGKFADKMGGVPLAKKVLDTLAKIRG